MPEVALCYLQEVGSTGKEWKTLVIALRWLKIINYEHDGSGEGLRGAGCFPGEYQKAPNIQS